MGVLSVDDCLTTFSCSSFRLEAVSSCMRSFRLRLLFVSSLLAPLSFLPFDRACSNTRLIRCTGSFYRQMRFHLFLFKFRPRGALLD